MQEAKNGAMARKPTVRFTPNKKKIREHMAKQRYDE